MAIIFKFTPMSTGTQNLTLFLMTPAERKINLNIFGLLLFLALAAYSLFCLYIGTDTLTRFAKVSCPPRRDNWRPNFYFSQSFDYDLRLEDSIKWSIVIGIPSFKRLDFQITGEDLDLVKNIGYIAFGCFVLASLLQSYVALRTILQPSYTVGTNGSEVTKMI